MGGLSAIREMEEYKYPSFLSFPGEGGEEREGDFDIVLPKLKKNFEVKVRLKVTKTFKHQKPKDLEYYWKEKVEEKECLGCSSRKRKRRGGYCDFTSY